MEKILVTSIICVLLGISLFLTCKAKNQPSQPEMTAKELFELFIQKPIPPTVQIIHGEKPKFNPQRTKISVSGTVVFKTDKQTLNNIIKDYQRLVNCAPYRVFKEDLSKIFVLECYGKEELSGEIEKNRHLYWDPKGQTAYFYGWDEEK